MGLFEYAAQAGVDEAGAGVPPVGADVRLRPQVPQQRHQELPHVLPGVPAQAVALPEQIKSREVSWSCMKDLFRVESLRERLQKQ